MKPWRLFTWGSRDPKTGKLTKIAWPIYVAIGLFLTLIIFGLVTEARSAETTYTLETTVGQSWKKVNFVGDSARASLLVSDKWQISLAYIGEQHFTNRETIEDYLYISIDRRVYFRDPSKRFQPFLGLGFATLPTGTNWRVPLPIEFHLQGGLKYNDCFGDFNCVLLWDHISNGGLDNRNAGQDGIMTGIQYKF